MHIHITLNIRHIFKENHTKKEWNFWICDRFWQAQEGCLTSGTDYHRWRTWSTSIALRSTDYQISVLNPYFHSLFTLYLKSNTDFMLSSQNVQHFWVSNHTFTVLQAWASCNKFQLHFSTGFCSLFCLLPGVSVKICTASVSHHFNRLQIYLLMIFFFQLHRLERRARPYLITEFSSVTYWNIMLLGKK